MGYKDSLEEMAKVQVDCASSGGAEGRPVARTYDGDAAEGIINVPLGDGSCLVMLEMGSYRFRKIYLCSEHHLQRFADDTELTNTFCLLQLTTKEGICFRQIKGLFVFITAITIAVLATFRSSGVFWLSA